MTENKRIAKIGLTFAQIFVGCCSGVLAYLILWYLTNFLWGGLQGVKMNGFVNAILLLISFLIVYFGTIVASAEGVRQIGRFLSWKKTIPIKRLYEGSFLGLCAAVAILSVTRGDWDGTLQEWGDPIRTLGKFIYIFVIPLKLLTFGYSERLANPSSLFLLIISAPIGALISYYVTPSKKDEKKDSQEISSESEDDNKNRKRKK